MTFALPHSPHLLPWKTLQKASPDISQVAPEVNMGTAKSLLEKEQKYPHTCLYSHVQTADKTLGCNLWMWIHFIIFFYSSQSNPHSITGSEAFKRWQQELGRHSAQHDLCPLGGRRERTREEERGRGRKRADSKAAAASVSLRQIWNAGSKQSRVNSAWINHSLVFIALHFMLRPLPSRSVVRLRRSSRRGRCCELCQTVPRPSTGPVPPSAWKLRQAAP